MSFMTWDASLEIGIDVIDSQHRRIVDYINLLQEAIGSGDRDKVGEIINELIDYTVTHFAFEETLMEQKGYEYVSAHKKVHEAFTSKVSQYQQQFQRGEDIAKHLLSDLRVWLTNHIKRDDRDYANVVQQNMDKGWVSKALKRFFG